MSAISTVVGSTVLFDGNYGLEVSLVLVMLTSMRQVTEKLEELSRWVGRRLCLILGFRGIGVSMPLLSKKA